MSQQEVPGEAVLLDEQPADPAATTTNDGATSDGALSADESHPRSGFAVGLLVVLVGALIGFQSLGDNSFLTHLQTGRLMWADGFFSNDPYTFTGDPEARWVIQSWFASLVYGALYNLGGGTALRVFTGIVAATLAALLWDSSRSGHTLLARLAATVPAVLLGLKMWSERPLLLGLVFFASVLVLLSRDIDPKWLAPIAMFWVWVHGSFPLGVVLLCCLALGTRLDGERPTKELKALGWFVAGVLVGGIVNPFGPRLLWFPIALLSRREVLGLIREWKPLDPSFLPAQLFLVGAAIMVVALIRSRSFRAAIPSLVFLGLAIMSSRNMNVAAIVFVPAIAAGFAGTGTRTDDERAEWTTKLTVVATAGIICIALASLFTRPTWDVERYPVDAIDWLEERDYFSTDDNGAPGRLAHTDFAGGYIELRFNGEVPVFIDDRYEFHSTELVFDYLALARGEDNWEDALNRHNLDMLLWINEDVVAERIDDSADWTVEYQDDDWFIACRNDGCP